MSRIVYIVAVTLMCVQAGAQATPPSGSPPALTPTTPAVSVTPFPKSDAILPTGKHENVWGPFEGQVVDAETGKGIPGAAVIVFWKYTIPNPIEAHDEFEDARWAVTDADGRFNIPRRHPGVLRWPISRGAYLSCVAPGYLPYEFTPKYDKKIDASRLLEGPITVRLREAQGTLEQRMRQHRELTADERVRRYEESTASNLLSVPEKKLGELTRGINERRTAIGLPSMEVLHGELR